jgi:hypothetical protein
MKINGGEIGLDVAKIFLARAKSVFRPGAPEASTTGIDPQEFEAVGLLLRRLNLIRGAGEEASSATAIVEGLARFQRETGLPDTGAYTDETIDSLAIYDQKKNAGNKGLRDDLE